MNLMSLVLAYLAGAATVLFIEGLAIQSFLRDVQSALQDFFAMLVMK